VCVCVCVCVNSLLLSLSKSFGGKGNAQTASPVPSMPPKSRPRVLHRLCPPRHAPASLSHRAALPQCNSGWAHGAVTRFPASLWREPGRAGNHEASAHGQRRHAPEAH
jgi:hypothetical protein